MSQESITKKGPVNPAPAADPKAKWRTLSPATYKHRCRELSQIITSSAFSDDERRAALETLIEAHSILWTSSLANGRIRQVPAYVRAAWKEALNA